jgi:Zn-dependent M28 family amino/carboxypeptidase
MSPTSLRRRATAFAAVGLALVAAAPAAAATGSKPLEKAVTVDGVMRHERALQSIANLNGGIRASGTAGYTASADYVRHRLIDAGYTVRTQKFSFPFFQNTADPVLERVSPNPKTYVVDDDFTTLQYSGSGDATAKLVPTDDIQIPPGAEASSSNSGCEPGDFPAATDGNISLIQRGTCDFSVKAQNAEAAGAVGVIIFNEGQPGRQETLSGTLGGSGFTVPILGTSFAVGQELYDSAKAGATQVHVAASTISETRHTRNILADTPGGDPTRKVVVGSHLDSVTEGPGINDNGSGTATDLEIALQMAKLKIKPKRQVRFAFWGAEEENLLGSTYYVRHLTPREVGDHYANLNFDMLGSPNFVRFVYDGDGSDSQPAGPPGSGEIERIFTSYFTGRGLRTKATPFDGRSDYGPFIDVGIPAGGLFSGAEGIKTKGEASVYGGTAGAAYDACYHQACDTASNLNPTALSQLGDGDAHAVYRLATSDKDLFGETNARSLNARARGPEAIR